ncbi:hypothetical protein [Calothrix rhizosoleniae]|uniref:hypothetical protein n=1 Tax=Calothrix rhizosoleniae TaxID=888997 RepID=UPI000B4987CC|nr:hypothetical protein [Calothrix rhizosoleniae]
MEVYINGKPIRVKPQNAIGKGGEADVFDIGKGKVLKLFKSPHHADYQGLPQEQQAAEQRLKIHQHKLRAFPSNLPQRAIAPTDLATDKSGNKIVGYTMPLIQGAEVLLKYRERSFRQAGVSHQTVVQIFQDLHHTVDKLHFAGIVIGDFNDLNVLVKGTEAYLIDTDSFQFANFPCQLFTTRFVDPLLCNSQGSQPILHLQHNHNSDWYAFAIMLLQNLLFVDPYGGVYKPQQKSQKIPHAARPLHRITIFHPEVRYPKPAIPYKVLPDELLQYFHQVFEQDLRGEFPPQLLDNLHWTECINCGKEHARPTCPYCHQGAPTAIKSITVVRDKVTATRLFNTEGVILCTAVEQGKLYWLYYHRGQFHREDSSVVLQGESNPDLQWRIQGKTTFLGYQGQVIGFHPYKPLSRRAVDRIKVVFDTNQSNCYWINHGYLNHDGNLGDVCIGKVLPAQTQFWVGTNFGFGFYRAGNLNIAFVFDVRKPGINDRVKLPHWQGQLIHAHCSFSPDYAWLFLTNQEQGKICYRCVVVKSDGSVIASSQVNEGEEHWLAVLGKGGAANQSPYCVVNNFLLAATDEGIIRIEIQQGKLLQTKVFADTEPFVDGSSRLLAAPQGLYLVSSQEVYFLKK